MNCPETIESALEVVFNRIRRKRMEGLPLLNEALDVRAVGFRSWNQYRLGVLVTPWFMNLILLPNDADVWEGLQLGTKQTHQLPSGPYGFVLGKEEGIGRYQMCSLFSPMFEFADQETALVTAAAVMQALMDEEQRDTVSTREKEIESIWKSESKPYKNEPIDIINTDDPTVMNSRLEQPICRRDLLLGNLQSRSDRKMHTEKI